MINEEEEVIEVSKSQQKRKAKEVLQKAKELVALSEKQVEKLEYPDEIKLELLKAQKIKSKSAHGRQIKYIAKLMRSIDKDV